VTALLLRHLNPWLRSRPMPNSPTPTVRIRASHLVCNAVFACGVVVPVLLGGAIYVGFRDDNILILQLLESLGIQRPFRLAVPESLTFFVDSFPDGLWVFSFSLWLRIIWSGFTSWVFLPISLAIASEFGQLLQVVPGTFDVSDVSAYVAAYICSFFIPVSHENK